jgi:uncharacterized protein YkwD
LGLPRFALISGGAALIAVASAFFLATDWSDEPPPGQAAAIDGSAASADDAPLSVSAAFGTLNQDALLGGLLHMVADFQPTPTPSPTPTPQPTATPQPAPYTPPSDPPASNDDNDNPPSPPPPSGGCPSASMNGMAQALFNATNQARAQNGMGALSASGCVTYVAQIRSEDMAANNYFSHTSPNGSTAFTLMDQYGVPYGWAGENLARNNYPSNEAVSVAIRDLMNSPGHRANILSGNYTSMGIGYAVDGSGMHYFTMVFTGPP